MNFIGNLIWLIFGGLASALGYVVGGCILCLTVVGMPWGFQCFKVASMVLWPFGKKVITTNSASGCLPLLFNLIWILCGGLYTAIVHIFFAFLLGITVIGIPFAKQHLKLVELSLMPFGKVIIDA